MKLKHIAAAVITVAGAASFAPAFAGIDPGNNPELFFVAFDANVGSYTKDLGLKLDTWAGTSGLADTSASNFSFALGPAYQQYLAGSPSNIKWALYAVDSDGVGDPGDFRIFATSAASNNGAPNFNTNGNVQDVAGLLQLFTSAVSATGTHTAANAVNGESFNPKGTAAYYGDSILTPGDTFTSNVVGVSSSLYLAVQNDFDSSLNPLVTKFGGTVKFDGTNVIYTAVPEPETYAMLLAGLGVLGFVARRRRQA